MGFNYGKFRNRLEDLPALRDTILVSIGDDNINFEKYDFQLIADEVNRNLDIVQERYNARFNFPNVKKTERTEEI